MALILQFHLGQKQMIKRQLQDISLLCNNSSVIISNCKLETYVVSLLTHLELDVGLLPDDLVGEGDGVPQLQLRPTLTRQVHVNNLLYQMDN